MSNNQIFVTINNQRYELEDSTTLLELSKRFEKEYVSTIVAARVNNDIKELSFEIKENAEISFLDLTDEDGMRIYRRSLYFIFIMAVQDVFPDRKAVISHPMSNGVYCEINGKDELSEDDVELVEKRMREIAAGKMPFEKKEISTESARKLYKESGKLDKYEVLEHRQKPYVTFYNCGGYENYYYGYMVPDTGYINCFALKFHKPGVVIQFPSRKEPCRLQPFTEQKKLFNVFIEYKKWVRILGVENIGSLNDIVKAGEIGDLIRVSEALHEKKIAQIADKITNHEEEKRIVLISGPSSSGKTTFANRLGIQLRVNGFIPKTISLDNYFVNRDRTPLDEDGEYDYEALEAIDVELFNTHLSELLNGSEVEVPLYNFETGSRESVGKKMVIRDNNILVIEGIHGLNDKLTEAVSCEDKYKIYVSALTSINIDDHNRIPSTDTRILRRIVRDNQFRGCSAINTINRWPSVRRGEEKNIFPFQENADIMFNSSLVYELCLLKVYAEPLLLKLGPDNERYSEVKRLIEFLSYFLPIDAKDVPNNSIVKEFIGGSCFF
ncbi:nucleoside kinase [Ruminiclostridium cellulolyticum]|uniref:AAA ATPase n=1 Tax=Ruminiclostridium cellulolyticum (strain ATCC 35319 / DSM 5812 / JCM 6584 / H10) TaxID=394503 RepID=B8I1W3_RUMCH|nr:nucleoside kinase [Ruminiclostridium cellulolyticum]ACL75789.1 AAA ATPase [Ruminiclostridium cellulolyticum H10]